MKYLGKFSIIRTKITACDYDWIIKMILKNLNKKFIVAPVASHPIALALIDNNYQEVLDKINIVAPDSQYVRWSLRFLYNINLDERVYGPELFIRLLKTSEKRNFQVFLIGNNLPLLVEAIKKRYPKLIISGFFDLKQEKINERLIKKINIKLKRCLTNIIFIGIGSPNQHKLAIKIKSQKPIVCVGAAFNFISGLKNQAPNWMKKTGFEWVFRSIKEPSLLKRYFFYGHIYIFFIVFIYVKRLKRQFSRRESF